MPSGKKEKDIRYRHIKEKRLRKNRHKKKYNNTMSSELIINSSRDKSRIGLLKDKKLLSFIKKQMKQNLMLVIYM